MTLKVTQIIYQDYNLEEDGIPPHYAVQFVDDSSGFVDYEYFATAEDAYAFAEEARIYR